MKYDIQLMKPTKCNKYSTMKVNWDSEIIFNDVKLVDPKRGLFKLHQDHYKTILEIEEKIITLLGQDKYRDLLTSNIFLTQEHGQVFKCKDVSEDIDVGLYNLVINLPKIKIYSSQVVLYWKSLKLSESKNICNFEIYEEDTIDDEPEPDPFILDSMKTELYHRIEVIKDDFVKKMDALIEDVKSIKDLGDVSAFETIEATLIAL